MDYKTSGVDVEAGRNFVDQIKANVESTYSKEVLGGLGGFGGFIKIPQGFVNPILVAGTDGVGTKLELAQKYKKHFGVGIDLVAMCVNDVITSGAQPLFFLDYIATGALSPGNLANVISGIAEGCKKSGCSLLGGETAEMPGFYGKDEYDLCGTVVGVVDGDNLLSDRKINKGDLLVGLPSTGLHTNGYSLARKVLLNKFSIEEYIPELGLSIADSLLSIHKSYLNILSDALGQGWLLGLSHITGGGLEGNTYRVLSEEQKLKVDWDAWEWPPIFKLIKDVGNVPTSDMKRSFNLGMGMVMIIEKENITKAETYLKEKKEPYCILGEVA